MRIFAQHPKETERARFKTAVPRRAIIRNHKAAGQAMREPDWPRQRGCTCGGACPKCRAKSASSGRKPTRVAQAPAPTAILDRLSVTTLAGRHAPAFAATAPESPTIHPNGIETETGGDARTPAPAPGVFPPNPPAPPMPATPRSDCSVTGSFSTIPSGVLSATMTGSKLGTTFNMVGDFNPSIPCNCSCGEYRQYVRGSFTANGAPVTHYIGPGLTLHPTTFQLDGNATTANYFGRRDYRTSYSHFEPDQSGGCQFQGSDIPGISAGSGTALTVDLDFQGKLIDTCNGNNVLASASWSVQGSDTVP